MKPVKIYTSPVEALINLPQHIRQLHNVDVEFEYLAKSNTTIITSTFTIIDSDDNSVIQRLDITWGWDEYQIHAAIEHPPRQTFHVHTNDQLTYMAQYIVNHLPPKEEYNHDVDIRKVSAEQAKEIVQFSNKLTSGQCTTLIK